MRKVILVPGARLKFMKIAPIHRAFSGLILTRVSL